MSKITFRADDDLVDELERFDASKSEVMREALRSYLAGPRAPGVEDALADAARDDSLDGLVRAIVRDEIGAMLDRREKPRDVNVTIALDGDDGVNAGVRSEAALDVDGSDRTQSEFPTAGDSRKTIDGEPDRGDLRQCEQCGHAVDDGHVYCPNCGEKATRRIFCECGDELRSDWSFCPGCGRRTPAADVLESR